jgi:hypothetical protein
VTDGTRTHNHRDHNPGLYQLSYGHRGDEQSSPRLGVSGPAWAPMMGRSCRPSPLVDVHVLVSQSPPAWQTRLPRERHSVDDARLDVRPQAISDPFR